MNWRETPHVEWHKCGPPGMIGYEELKQDEMAEAGEQREIVWNDVETGMVPVVSSLPGFTGATQFAFCKACGAPMISREYKFDGAKVWTNIHPTEKCRQLALSKCHRVRKEGKIKHLNKKK